MQQRREAFLRWALGGVGRRGWAVPSTPAPARRPPRSHRLLQGATESSGYGILGIAERCEVEGMHIGDI